MKLRDRLFLWVGIIFLAAFGVSYYFEMRTTDISLDESEKVLREKVLALNEEKREHIEEYLHIALAEDQAEIDSLLLRLTRDPTLGSKLFLTPENLQLVAPANASTLFKNDKWIDFIQSTKEGELTSLLIPIDFPMEDAHEIPIQDGISWVYLSSDKKLRTPFIAVAMETEVSADAMIDTDLGLRALFDPNTLAEQPAKEEDGSSFITAYNRAVAYVKENQAPGWVQQQIREKGGPNLFEGKPFDHGIECLRQDGAVLNNRIIQLLQRNDQAIMVASLGNLFPTGHFGTTPFSPSAPKGIARFSEGNPVGHLILTDEVFFQKKIFADERYLKAHPSFMGCEGVGSSVAVIAPPGAERIFVGNSLEIQDGDRVGFLTIGVDADELVQNLVLAQHELGFLVHDGKVISAFNADGEKIPDPAIDFTSDMLDSKSGVVNWRGRNYYYLHMIPFKTLDLHFFVLKLEKKAFALADAVRKESREVIHNVSVNMRIISLISLVFVLLLLHRVAKRITGPITALANVTQDVAKGKLEGIELPQAPKGRHDEIATLCTSFEQMVKGLQEKEKVKGVLNKVVSTEIAQEIMKGSVHLGGEEKRVTVLFADIRGFTQMTADMDPGQVIEMLNACMTKISHEVDEFGGVIDKYVGDEVMALFGAPLEKEDSALNAIRAAHAMIRVLNQWNQERSKSGLSPVEMGIGIHTGTVLVGNMGAENRLNYTVLGSNVNLAARLCGGAAPMQILITDEVMKEAHVSENIETNQLEPKQFKGFAEPTPVFEVKGVRNV